MLQPTTQLIVDEKIHCLNCGYNLTGLTTERCPECGSSLNWEFRRKINAYDQGPGLPWERWPLWSKPAAFFATVFLAVFMPWEFAQRIPIRPRVGWALLYGLMCLTGIFITCLNPVRDVLKLYADYGEIGLAPILKWDLRSGWFYLWSLGAIIYLLLMTFLLGKKVEPYCSENHSYLWWFCVCCYTSWPLIIEGLISGPVFIVPGFFMIPTTNLWPFSIVLHMGNVKTNYIATFLFYFWWLNLAVITCSRTTGLKRRNAAFKLTYYVPTIYLMTMLIVWVFGFLYKYVLHTPHSPQHSPGSF